MQAFLCKSHLDTLLGKKANKILFETGVKRTVTPHPLLIAASDSSGRDTCQTVGLLKQQLL